MLYHRTQSADETQNFDVAPTDLFYNVWWLSAELGGSGTFLHMDEDHSNCRIFTFDPHMVGGHRAARWSFGKTSVITASPLNSSRWGPSRGLSKSLRADLIQNTPFHFYAFHYFFHEIFRNNKTNQSLSKRLDK